MALRSAIHPQPKHTADGQASVDPWAGQCLPSATVGSIDLALTGPISITWNVTLLRSRQSLAFSDMKSVVSIGSRSAQFAGAWKLGLPIRMVAELPEETSAKLGRPAEMLFRDARGRLLNLKGRS
jgi:hypothetical protein